MAERNTYMKYKEGTSKIAGWLVETARRCGVDVEPHITYRHRPTSPNAGTGAGQQTTLRIRIKSFTFLANRIAESDIQLPKIIAWLIRKVIKLRKEADEAFARASKGLGPRDIGHRYFIRVLEEVYEILQSRSNHANSDGWEVAYGTASPETESPSFKSLTLQGDDIESDVVIVSVPSVWILRAE